MSGALSAAAFLPVRADDAPVRGNSHRTKAYNIRTTDKLRITVFQEDDLSTICRVDAKGTVNLPLVGEIRVFGQTLSQAERTIEAAYKDGRFLRKPEVTVDGRGVRASRGVDPGPGQEPGAATPFRSSPR